MKEVENEFEVVCGNIGSVYNGDDKTEADRIFDTYVEQSNSGVGRAGGEDVTMFRHYPADCMIIKEHFGSNSQNDI